MADLGKVAIVPAGEYVDGTEYERLDMVTYGSGVYIAKEDNKDVLPTDSSVWMHIGDYATVANMTVTKNGIGRPDDDTIKVNANGVFRCTCKMEKVNFAPSAENAVKNTVYLVEDSAVTGVNKYQMWTLIGNEMVCISDRSPDLSNYVLLTDFETHRDSSVVSEDGVHGVRYYEEKFQGYDTENDEWFEIKDDTVRNKLNIINRKTRRRLSTSDLTALKTAITSGDFGGINIKDGDYFSGASGLKYTLGEFNHFKGSTTQYSVIADNHYAIVVDCMGETAWNSAGNTTGAYKASTLRTYLTETALPKVLSDMQALGFTVISRQCLESNTFDSTGVNRCGKATGCSSGWERIAEQIIALSEPQVYGSVIAGSSFYDVGEANRQLNCFKEHSFMDISDMKSFWLKEPGSSGCACYVSGNRGNALGDSGVAYTGAAFGLIVIN